MPAALAKANPIKAKLRANTREAIDRGAFGSPMMFVDETYAYFGNDQPPHVKQRLLQEPGLSTFR